MNMLATLDSVKNNITHIAAITGLKAKEHSPEILMVSGVVSIIVGTALACKATLKVDEILDEATEKQAEMDAAMNKFDGHVATNGKAIVYTQDDYTHDKLILRARTIGKLVKNYAPAALFLTSGIVMMCCAHGIMKKRNAALMAAYQAVDLAFKNYRQRVVEEEGELKDRHYLTGSEYKEIENPETGEKEIVEETTDKTVSSSMYTRFFDESSRYWKKNADMNKTFLLCAQNQLNNKLYHQGYLFLNEVYEALDILPTPAGQVVGWVWSEGVKVDLGVFDESDTCKRRFVNGIERVVRIDPNVQGVVYDLVESISKKKRGLL